MESQELMRSRHDATPFPLPTENPADDAEKVAQWLLECTFFKPFTYRNPPKDPQKEFSDALIIFDDTIIIIQIKTKTSERSDTDWMTKHANKASKQLNGSYRQLKDRLVKSFTNPIFSVQKDVGLSQYSYVYGMILLAGVIEVIDPLSLIEHKNKPVIPTVFVSISDLQIITKRVNTAADFIHYCEAHTKLAIQEAVPINHAIENLTRIASQVPELLSEGRPVESFTGKHLLGFEWISRLFSGEVNCDPDYRYSLLVDDIISNSSNLDLEYSGPMSESLLNPLRIAEQLGWLDRKRRIELGKQLYQFAAAARDGNTRFLAYMRPTMAVLFLFMYTVEERKARQEQLYAFIRLAQVKYGVTRVLGIATEPIGSRRSYDLIWVEELLVKPETIFSNEIFGALPELNRSLFME